MASLLDEEEEEIQRRVALEMRQVYMEMKAPPPPQTDSWSAPTLVAAVQQAAPSSSTSSFRGSRPTPAAPDVDEEEELRTRQAVEAQVKRRAQELFEAMRQLEEEKERQRLASEIDRRVADEARRKAETLLRAEDEERERRKAAAAAEAEAEAAALAAQRQLADTARLIDEQVRRRVDEEARRIKELLLHFGAHHLDVATASAAAASAGAGTFPRGAVADLEPACEPWEPVTFEPTAAAAAGGRTHTKPPEVEGASPERYTKHPVPAPAPPSSSSSSSSSEGVVQMTPAEIERLIAAEVDRLISQRAAPPSPHAQRNFLSINHSPHSHGEKQQHQHPERQHRRSKPAPAEHEAKRVPAVADGGGKDVAQGRGRRSNSADSGHTTSSSLMLDADGGSTPTKGRSNSVGKAPGTDSPPLHLPPPAAGQRPKHAPQPPQVPSSSPSPSPPPLPPAAAGKGRTKATVLPPPRAKSFLTPEKMPRTAPSWSPSPAAGQSPAGLVQGMGLSARGHFASSPPASPMAADVPSDLDFLDATFSGEKYTGLELASHRLVYTVVGGPARVVRGVDCCVVLRSSLRSQITAGDVLVSVNDWPLINIPTAALSGGTHFEAVLRLLRLATPPRRIRFMRAHETAASASGLSDVSLLKLTADDAELLYDALSADDFEALTAGVAAAAAAEAQLRLRASTNAGAGTGMDKGGAKASSKGARGSTQSGSTRDASATESPTPSSQADVAPRPPLDPAAATAVSVGSTGAPIVTSSAVPSETTDEQPTHGQGQGQGREQQQQSPARDGCSEVDCAASALTTNTGLLFPALGPVPPGVAGGSTHPHSRHPARPAGLYQGGGATASEPATPRRRRVVGFFKAVGRAIGLRRSTKQQSQQHDVASMSALVSASASVSVQSSPGVRRGRGGGADTLPPAPAASSHSLRTVPAAPSLPPQPLQPPQPPQPPMPPAAAAATASFHFKSFPSPGSLGLKLTYHNLMYPGARGQMQSVNCLVVGGFANGQPPPSPELCRVGDVLMNVNGCPLLAAHRHSDGDRADHADSTAEAKAFFGQAVGALADARVPRVIKFFRLPDARTATSGRVFTMLGASEADALVPHLSLMPAADMLLHVET